MPLIIMQLVLFYLQILVIYCGTDNIRKATICGILLQINKDGLHRLILVLQSKMNSHARKVLDEYPIKAEIFHVSHLKYATFPSSHVYFSFGLVP